MPFRLQILVAEDNSDCALSLALLLHLCGHLWEMKATNTTALGEASWRQRSKNCTLRTSGSRSSKGSS
jgi:hypothetical protein